MAYHNVLYYLIWCDLIWAWHISIIFVTWHVSMVHVTWYMRWHIYVTWHVTYTYDMIWYDMICDSEFLGLTSLSLSLSSLRLSRYIYIYVYIYNDSSEPHTCNEIAWSMLIVARLKKSTMDSDRLISRYQFCSLAIASFWLEVTSDIVNLCQLWTLLSPGHFEAVRNDKVACWTKTSVLSRPITFEDLAQCA